MLSVYLEMVLSLSLISSENQLQVFEKENYVMDDILLGMENNNTVLFKESQVTTLT